MGLFSGTFVDSVKQVRFNTGTWFDMVSGIFEHGYADGLYLNGGLGTCTTGLHGGGNTNKSTIFDTVIAGTMRYYGLDCICQDTEYSKVKERMMRFAQGARYGNANLDDQLTLISDPNCGIEWTNDAINKICEVQEANRKDRMITTPFMDTKGKLVTLLKPSILYIDSWSELTTVAIINFLRDKGLSEDKFRTLYMENGNRKTLLLTYLNQMAKKHGIIVCATARTGRNQSMDHMPPPKELAHQKQKDKIKDVGSKFTTLVHVLMQVQTCKVLQDSTQKAEYPLGDTGSLDLYRVEINSSRNKSNLSGPLIPMIVSQEWGLLPEVSYFDFLRLYATNSIGTGRPYYSCPFLPDVKFTRKSIRSDLMENYQLCRALELAAQYLYVQLSWNTGSLPVKFDVPVEKVFDKLTSSDPLMKDILESTGAWAPVDVSKKHKHGEIPGVLGRKHMSLFEVLKKVQAI